MTYQEILAIIKPVIMQKPNSTFDCSLAHLIDFLCRYSGQVRETFNVRNLFCQAHIDAGLILNPDFQRGAVWDTNQQRYFVENLFRGKVSENAKILSFNHDDDENLICLDGLQRLTALLCFYRGDFLLFDKLSFCDLTKHRQLLRQQALKIRLYDFNSRKEMIGFYLDFNHAGVAHSKGELERVEALYLKE